jgi:hypothetical protein
MMILQYMLQDSPEWIFQEVEVCRKDKNGEISIIMRDSDTEPLGLKKGEHAKCILRSDSGEVLMKFEMGSNFDTTPCEPIEESPSFISMVAGDDFEMVPGPTRA